MPHVEGDRFFRIQTFETRRSGKILFRMAHAQFSQTAIFRQFKERREHGKTTHAKFIGRVKNPSYKVKSMPSSAIGHIVDGVNSFRHSPSSPRQAIEQIP